MTAGSFDAMLIAGRCLWPCLVLAQLVCASPQGELRSHEDVVFAFRATDGTALEAKLSMPVERAKPVPVVFYLHGAGPRTFDHPVPCRDEKGEVRYESYFELHARELAKRGVAFCRMSKRGCKAKSEPLSMQLDLKAFGKATMDLLLDDYSRGLAALRKREEIDAEHVVLWGSSEGTRLAPLLAAKSPEGIVGVALTAYAADNARDTVVWQTTKGPFRNVQALFEGARDGELTEVEYQETVEARPELAAALAFEGIAGDDGVLTSEDLEKAIKPRLDFLLGAIEKGDDEKLQRAILGLSSAYFKSWWDAVPNEKNLLELSVPIAIFHGELDGTCRVEGVRQAQAAFAKAGADNLRVHTYPLLDHNLGWTCESARKGGSKPFRDAVKFAAGLVRR